MVFEHFAFALALALAVLGALGVLALSCSWSLQPIGSVRGGWLGGFVTVPSPRGHIMKHGFWAVSWEATPVGDWCIEKRPSFLGRQA